MSKKKKTLPGNNKAKINTTIDKFIDRLAILGDCIEREKSGAKTPTGKNSFEDFKDIIEAIADEGNLSNELHHFACDCAAHAWKVAYDLGIDIKPEAKELILTKRAWIEGLINKKTLQQLQEKTAKFLDVTVLACYHQATRYNSFMAARHAFVSSIYAVYASRVYFDNENEKRRNEIEFDELNFQREQLVKRIDGKRKKILELVKQDFLIS